MTIPRPRPENINRPVDQDGNTYLHLLCAEDAPVQRIREAIEELGANIHVRNDHNMTPLGVALHRASSDVIECLLDYGAELYFPVGEGKFFNAAYIALYNRWPSALQIVLARGGGVHVNQSGIDPDGDPGIHTCLHKAIRSCGQKEVEALIKAGATVDDASGPEQLTPLQLAASIGDTRSIAVLIKHGAHIDARHPISGNTALHFAALSGRTLAAEALIKKGADLEAVPQNGLTPLMMAALDGNLSLVESLIAAGARIDRPQKKTGETALMMAARKGYSGVSAFLLKAGANPILTDVFNRTALDHAEECQTSYDARETLRTATNRAMRLRTERSYKKYRPGK